MSDLGVPLKVLVQRYGTACANEAYMASDGASHEDMARQGSYVESLEDAIVAEIDRLCALIANGPWTS